jgi:histidinol-phosphatase (PHP family)
MYIDYHVHPDYSVDASNSIDEYCRKAVEIGLDEICFTTHYDIDPFRKEKDDFVRVDGKIVSFENNWLDRYFEDLNKAKTKYEHSGLKVKFGIEVEYIKGIEEEIRRNLKDYSFDLILGAIHGLDHRAIHLEDEFKTCFQGLTAKEMCEKYYREVEEAVESGLFDVVAHLDLYKKFGLSYYGEELLNKCNILVDRVFDLMENRAVGLEINTSCYRYGFNEPFPSIELLEKWGQRNPCLLTIGSDAHGIEYLAQNIDKGIEIAKKLGLKLYTYKKGKVEKYF